jgi:hypothetical protein
MKWVGFAVAALAALAAIVALVGTQLPRDHVASRTLRVRRTPEEIWPVVTRLMAASAVPADIIEHDPPRRLVSRVKETEKMFGGTWTVVSAPIREGSTLTITENGWVANPIFRFVSRFVVGHHGTMDGILKGVAKELGEEPALSGE